MHELYDSSSFSSDGRAFDSSSTYSSPSSTYGSSGSAPRDQIVYDTTRGRFYDPSLNANFPVPVPTAYVAGTKRGAQPGQAAVYYDLGR